MKTEIDKRDRSNSFDISVGRSNTRKQIERRCPSTAALVVKDRRNHCVFCDGKHASEHCDNVKTLDVNVIKELVKKFKLCFRCFRDSHLARQCKVRCTICHKNHNYLFCFKRQDCQTTETNTNPKVVTFSSSEISGKSTMMQVCTLYVDKVNLTLLFDNGSDRSFISSDAVKRLRPNYVGKEDISYCGFGESVPTKVVSRNVYNVQFNGKEKSEKILLTEIPEICTTMYRPKVPVKLLEEFQGLKWANRYDKGERVKVDVLIGLDYYWKLMRPGKSAHSASGLVANETIFGNWVLSGSWQTENYPRTRVSNGNQLLVLDTVSDATVRRFWEIDSLGVMKDNNTHKDHTLESFNRSILFIDNRYEVKLPWVEEKKPFLLNNFDQACKRLDSLNKRLVKTPSLREEYMLVMQNLEKEDIIEEVLPHEIDRSDRSVYYLPHRPVVKESSSSTKVRPVFDASALGSNGVSLNDCMEKGPPLTANLLDVLLRFRRWKYALTADVSKAFLQIRVNESDRDVHRFLLTQANSFRVMRINRVPFGNTASPFLLNATIKFHLSRQPNSRAVTELDTNLYVDDWLSGADQESELNELKADANIVMNKANLPLTKWCSNNAKVVEQPLNEQLFKEKDHAIDQCKVLGILWKPEEDKLSFGGIDVNILNMVITKRVVLGMISRIFDPMGFLQPYVMSAKIIFQGLWKLGLGWDDQLPEVEEKKFQGWLKELPELRKFSVPRCFVNRSWDNKLKVELHAFGDSSELGYGTCVYLKIVEEDGFIQTSLVLSKARLAPIKKVTLPRLELMGALLSARLVTYVKRALLLPEDTKCYCWTDSTVALQWIKGDANKWKPFVSNRVAEIQELTSPECWGHCRGVENPADILTRGFSLESLISSNFWLHGPVWLSQEVFVESDCLVTDSRVVVDEILCDDLVQLKVESQSVSLFPVQRWGALSKALRVCAFVLRFCRNLKARSGKFQCSSRSGELVTEELSEAHKRLMIDTQVQYYGKEITELKNGRQVHRQSSIFKMKPFLDENGLMRMSGRLNLSCNLSYNEKHPIILPKGHLSLLIVRDEHVNLKHGGVAQVMTSLRNRFWIVGLRNIAKQVKRQCTPCIRHDSRLPNQVPAPIPRKRIEMAPPFAIVGVDYAGPLFTADFVGKKFYLLMFTCAVIRAIHIELVDSLSMVISYLHLGVSQREEVCQILLFLTMQKRSRPLHHI